MANLDGFTVARTIKLMPETQKLKAEDEAAREEQLREQPAQVHTEFHGGGDADELEPEDDAGPERTVPVQTFDIAELQNMLTRQNEVAAGNKKGRKKHADVQMKLFDDLFHDALTKPLNVTPTKLYDVQLSYTDPQSQDTALVTQREILKQLRAD